MAIIQMMMDLNALNVATIIARNVLVELIPVRSVTKVILSLITNASNAFKAVFGAQLLNSVTALAARKDITRIPYSNVLHVLKDALVVHQLLLARLVVKATS